MGVNLDQPERALLADCTKDRKRHSVIAANGNWQRADCMDPSIECLNKFNAAFHVQGMGRRIANIGDIAQAVGRHLGRRIDLPD
jgi:hypothetical protein